MSAPIRELPWDPVAEAARNWEEHGWTSAASGMSAITSVLRADRLYQAKMDQILRQYGLNALRYEVLILIFFSKRSALPLGVISDRLQINPPTITYCVRSLESSGLVARTPNPDDGRGIIAVLTLEGHKVVREATEVVNREVFERVALTAEECLQLNGLLFKLRHELAMERDPISAP
jgi:DNA-binding MarR family transcriptional regulator